MSKINLNTLHLTSSRFYGGPERQMLGLAMAMRPDVDTYFASFSESGLNESFLNEVEQAGFTGYSLKHDTPRLMAACRETMRLIQDRDIAVLICHGYKAGLIGWWAAKRAGIPVMAVSRGWTGETWKVRVYEKIDRWMLRRMDHVVCVSNGQATKVKSSKVKEDRISVIHNSVNTGRFAQSSGDSRNQLNCMFPEESRDSIGFLIGAAGRLSPEKGFDILIDAAKPILNEFQNVGFVLFGDGQLKQELQERIDANHLQDRFILAGFTSELDQFMPCLDLFVQSSHTEGLPNVLLESLAANVPVVATEVGGTGELVKEGKHGYLVPAAEPEALTNSIKKALSDREKLAEMATEGKKWIESNFTFAKQAEAYKSLLTDLTSPRKTK